MRMLTTLGEANAIVREKAKTHRDKTMPATAIRFNDFDTVTVDGGAYAMQKSAQRLISGRLKIPFEYLKRCPRHLQEENLNHWMQGLGSKPLFLRFADQSLRAVFTTRYQVINNVDIIDRLLRTGFSEEEEIFFTFSDEIMVINRPKMAQVFRLMQEELVPGISIANSEVGVSCFAVQSFYLRLICTNGLISAETVNRRIRHVRKSALQDFDSLIGGLEMLTSDSQRKMQAAINQPVEEPLKTIESFNRQFGVKSKDAAIVADSWQAEALYSMWGVINAYTRASHSMSVSEFTAYRLQQIGGLILNMLKC